MNLKKIAILVLLCATCAFMFADDDELLPLPPLPPAPNSIVELGSNVKVSTKADILSINKKLSLEEAIELAMRHASIWNYANYSVKIYKNAKALTKSGDFDDDYIYGLAINAVEKLHYGTVKIEYYRYDDEINNLVGWDCLYFITLNDGRILCEKILEWDIDE